MNSAESIAVADIESLLALLDQFDLWGKWWVRCEVGPDWIGAGRSIQFYLGERPLADTALHTYLKGELVNVLDIPERCEDALIVGEGDIFRKRTVLEVEYEWWEAVPYMYPREVQAGKAVLVAIS